MGGRKRKCSPSTLKRGDQICVERSFYDHHGIYVGNNMVIHLIVSEKKSNFSKVSAGASSYARSPPCKDCGYRSDSDFEIVKTCLDCFLNGDSLYIVEYEVSACKPPEEVVKTATNLLQGGGGYDDYHLIANNCEHFASYCKTGERTSSQIQNFEKTTKGVAKTAAAVAATAALVAVAATAVARVLSTGNHPNENEEQQTEGQVDLLGSEEYKTL